MIKSWIAVQDYKENSLANYMLFWILGYSLTHGVEHNHSYALERFSEKKHPCDTILSLFY